MTTRPQPDTWQLFVEMKFSKRLFSILSLSLYDTYVIYFIYINLRQPQRQKKSEGECKKKQHTSSKVRTLFPTAAAAEVAPHRRKRVWTAAVIAKVKTALAFAAVDGERAIMPFVSWLLHAASSFHRHRPYCCCYFRSSILVLRHHHHLAVSAASVAASPDRTIAIPTISTTTTFIVAVAPLMTHPRHQQQLHNRITPHGIHHHR